MSDPNAKPVQHNMKCRNPKCSSIKAVEIPVPGNTRRYYCVSCKYSWVAPSAAPSRGNMSLLDELVEDFSEHIPGLNVKFKDESKLMGVLGFLLRPLNPTFMTRYTTTWGNTVYFPHRKFVQTFPTTSVSVLTHEFVHLWDEQKLGSWKYRYLYVAPQIFGLLTLALYAVFFSAWPLALLVASYLGCCVLSKNHSTLSQVLLGVSLVSVLGLSWVLSGFWGPLALLASVIPLGPWPARGRVWLELRGYSMSIASYRWLRGESMPESVVDELVNFFTGPGYYFMSWRGSAVREALERASKDCASGAILRDEAFGVVYSSLRKRGGLHS